EAEEEISPGPKFLAARQTQVGLLRADWIQFVKLFVARERPGRFEMIDDGERNQHRAAPGRHFVDVKWRPARQQNHFHWNGRQIFPWKLAEQREVKLAERVHS